jgi:hypothetical protein
MDSSTAEFKLHGVATTGVERGGLIAVVSACVVSARVASSGEGEHIKRSCVVDRAQNLATNCEFAMILQVLYVPQFHREHLLLLLAAASKAA